MENYNFDKTKTYTYETSNGQEITLKYSESYQDGSNTWDIWLDSDGISSVTREDDSGFYEGILESEFEQSIKYPLVLNESWQSGLEGSSSYELVAIGVVERVKAGTFSDVIIVTSDDGNTSYFAKGVGRIKSSHHGEVTELKKIEDR